ncbi:PIG-L family deacetylase [Robbsia sp. KACC 23696]|uniref:PIG-L deacetylase family protein n=1 Tax=Robbsia sp. KACC 23696 TaxID=3149231 RepID=UPI00325C1010
MSLDVDQPVFGTFGRVVVVSPHLDDAALSCGALIADCADATVVTLFAGTPPDAFLSTAWDRECGYGSAEQAVRARREEDHVAMMSLGAAVVHMDCLDGQYLPASPSADEIERDDADNAGALAAVLKNLAPDLIIVPLGLFHSDHIRARRAWIRCASAPVLRAIPWIAYEDVPYRSIGGALQRALVALHHADFIATPARWQRPASSAAVGGTRDVPNGSTGRASLPLHGGADRAAFQCKHTAIRAYDSQLGALGAAALDDANAPERFWAISPSHAAS